MKTDKEILDYFDRSLGRLSVFYDGEKGTWTVKHRDRMKEVVTESTSLREAVSKYMERTSLL